MDTFHDRTVAEINAMELLQKKVDEAYRLGYTVGHSEAANELNARLTQRQIDFNEADHRRVARIQELEDQLRLKQNEVDQWESDYHDMFEKR